MNFPKDLLDAFFCKWEKEFHLAFNQELIARGMEPITYEEYFDLLQQEADRDDLMAPNPRIR